MPSARAPAYLQRSQLRARQTAPPQAPHAATHGRHHGNSVPPAAEVTPLPPSRRLRTAAEPATGTQDTCAPRPTPPAKLLPGRRRVSGVATSPLHTPLKGLLLAPDSQGRAEALLPSQRILGVVVQSPDEGGAYMGTFPSSVTSEEAAVLAAESAARTSRTRTSVMS